MTKDSNNHSTIKLLSFMGISESFSKNFKNNILKILINIQHSS